MELFRLKNKVAVVTGSSRGIGYSIAKNLALSGARVIVTSRSDASCKKAVNKIKKLGGIAHAVSANINSKDQLNNLIKVTNEVFKKIDILVCNAATNPYYGSMSKIPDNAFIKVMNNNILSNHWLSNLVLPSMKKRRNGVILIISSIGGLRGSNSLGAYAVSKAADMQLVRNIAVENGKYNIRANCIAPGLIKTKFARALWQNKNIRKKYENLTPLQRIGMPDDIGGIAVFLASKAGAFISGQTIVADGGMIINS